MKMLSQQENVLLPGARGFRAPASAEIDPAHLGKRGSGCLPRVQGEDLKTEQNNSIIDYFKEGHRVYTSQRLLTLFSPSFAALCLTAPTSSSSGFCKL